MNPTPNTQNPCECPQCGDIRWNDVKLATGGWDFACDNCDLRLGYALRSSELYTGDLLDHSITRGNFIQKGIQRLRSRRQELR